MNSSLTANALDELTPKLRRKLQDRIDNKYVIVFGDGVSDVDAKKRALELDFPEIQVTHSYHYAIKGVSITMPGPLGADVFDHDPDVLYVEEVSYNICSSKVLFLLVQFDK